MRAQRRGILNSDSVVGEKPITDGRHDAPKSGQVEVTTVSEARAEARARKASMPGPSWSKGTNRTASWNMNRSKAKSYVTERSLRAPIPFVRVSSHR